MSNEPISMYVIPSICAQSKSEPVAVPVQYLEYLTAFLDGMTALTSNAEGFEDKYKYFVEKYPQDSDLDIEDDW